MELDPVIVPISSLERLDRPECKHLKGIISLVWPFSSSTRRCAFLVVEPDARLRFKKGQVRVQVHGPAAVAVAGSKLGIGDEILLSLNHAKWTEATQGVSTPGRSVDLELIYNKYIDVEIRKQGSDVVKLHVDEPFDSVPDGAVQSLFDTPTRSATPIPRRLLRDNINTTPVFHQKARLSGGSAVDSPLDPFGGDDLDESEFRRKRPRVSWGTPKNRWKVIQVAPSPEKPQKSKDDDVFWLGSQQNDLTDDESPTPSVADSNATSAFSEAELTQLVENERKDSLMRKRAQELANESFSSMTFEPYRDAIEPLHFQTQGDGFVRIQPETLAETPSSAVQTTTQQMEIRIPVGQEPPPVVQSSSKRASTSSKQPLEAQTATPSPSNTRDSHVEQPPPDIVEISSDETSDEDEDVESVGDVESEDHQLEEILSEDVEPEVVEHEDVEHEDAEREDVEHENVEHDDVDLAVLEHGDVDPVDVVQQDHTIETHNVTQRSISPAAIVQVVTGTISHRPGSQEVTPQEAISKDTMESQPLDAGSMVDDSITQEAVASVMAPLVTTKLVSQDADVGPTTSSSLPTPSPILSSTPSARVDPAITVSPSKSSFKFQPSQRLSDSIFGFGFRSSRASAGSRTSGGSLESFGSQATSAPAEKEKAQSVSHVLQPRDGHEDDDDLYGPRSRHTSPTSEVHMRRATSPVVLSDEHDIDPVHQGSIMPSATVMSTFGASQQPRKSHAQTSIDDSDDTVRPEGSDGQAIGREIQSPSPLTQEVGVEHATLPEGQGFPTGSFADSNITADSLSFRSNVRDVVDTISKPLKATDRSFETSLQSEDTSFANAQAHRISSSAGIPLQEKPLSPAASFEESFTYGLTDHSANDEQSQIALNRISPPREVQSWRAQDEDHVLPSLSSFYNLGQDQVQVEESQQLAASPFVRILEDEEASRVEDSHGSDARRDDQTVVHEPSNDPQSSSFMSLSRFENVKPFGKTPEMVDLTASFPQTSDEVVAETIPSTVDHVSYPDLTSQLDAIQESPEEQSQATVVPSSPAPRQAHQGLGTRTNLRQSSTGSHDARSSQPTPARAFTRSSSGIDVMGFFGVKRDVPRVAQQTTAVRSELSTMVRGLGDQSQPEVEQASSMPERRVQRRPGETRKKLKIPTPAPLLPLSQSQSSNLVNYASTFEELEKQLSPVCARTRSQSIQSQSQIVESVETYGSQRSNTASATPVRRSRRLSQSMKSLEPLLAPSAQEVVASPSRVLRSASKTLQSPAKIAPSPVKSKKASAKVPQSQEMMMSTAMTQDDPFTQDDDALQLPNHPSFIGLRTSYSYYAPLSDLSNYLNKTSSFDSTLDVIAVVYRATVPAAKADKGRKDWYTKMRVTQPGFYPQTTLVQVFRSYKAAVPQAEIGDVVLLRSFNACPSRGGTAGLRNPENSAWCVFKADAKNPGKPLRRGKKKGDDVDDEREGEVVTGPPAEFGDRERAAVEEMKAWWKEVRILKQESGSRKAA